jgi:hypothetical protein
MTNAFNWLITNAGLAGVSLTDTAPYPIIGSTTNPYAVNLTNLAIFIPPYSPYSGYHVAYLQSGPPVDWWFAENGGQLQETFNVATAGIYTVSVDAEGTGTATNGPTMEVYFGPGHGSVCVNTTNYSTYNFTFTIPAGVWDLVITPNYPASGSVRGLTFSNIQISKQ